MILDKKAIIGCNFIYIRDVLLVISIERDLGAAAAIGRRIGVSIINTVAHFFEYLKPFTPLSLSLSLHVDI